MLIANSFIKLPPSVTIHDLMHIAIRRGTLITESARMLKGQHLYSVEKEVGLWTFEELRRHFLN